MRKPPASTHAVAAIEHVVGASTYARGWVYAQSGHVAGLQFDPHELALSAMVLGSRQQAYATTVYLEESGDSGFAFEQGQCTCPIGIDCKHAVAVALAAPSVVSGRLRDPAVPALQHWERSLRPFSTPPRRSWRYLPTRHRWPCSCRSPARHRREGGPRPRRRSAYWPGQ